MQQHCLRLLLLLVLASPGVLLGRMTNEPGVVINEIMYAPANPEPEWIEILNRGTEPVNLRKWQITDATATKHIFPSTEIILPAGGYLLLTKDSTALREAREVLPCAVVSVSGFPSLNNSGDAVVLFDSQGRMVDSLAYRPDWGGSDQGRSLERRDAGAPSTEPGNWGNCTASAGATPGLPNSIIRCSHDLAIVSLLLPDTGTVVGVVRNVGKLPAGGYTLALYDDANMDSIPAPAELAGRVAPAEPLSPGDSVRLSIAVTLSSGLHQLIADADFPADERPGDNRMVCRTTRPFLPGALLVNEIMADPAAGMSEYVELTNAGNRDVDVKGWTLTDLTGSAGKATISSTPRVIHPGELLLLAGDSALFGQFPSLADTDERLVTVLRAGGLSLNNDGDAVVVCDGLGVTIDSVMYSVVWHNPDLSDPGGRSLERISPAVSSNDPRNWGTSVDLSGGTPGARNSMSVRVMPAASRLSCMPNPFSPDADGVDDVVVIHYEMPLRTSIINLKIYDIRGRLIRRLASNEPGGPAGNIIWDGRDETGSIARMGIYIALLEAINSSGGLESAKGVVVLARRL